MGKKQRDGKEYSEWVFLHHWKRLSKRSGESTAATIPSQDQIVKNKMKKKQMLAASCLCDI